MAKLKFRPLHDRVVVKRIDAEAKTKGGIIIPDTVKEKPQEGEVVAVGPGGRDEAGKLTPMGVILPLSSRPPGPTATTSPSCGFSLTVSGMIMPPFVLSSPSMRRMTTRSCNGRNFMERSLQSSCVAGLGSCPSSWRQSREGAYIAMIGTRHKGVLTG